MAEPQAQPASALTLDIVTTLTGFEALERDWTGLQSRMASSSQVFQTYGWCRHWANAFLDRRRGSPRLAIVTGRIGGRLVMLWPLVMTTVAGLKELSWLGEPVSQYGDVLLEPGPDQARHLEAGWLHGIKTLKPGVVRLNKTRADSAVAPLLGRLGARLTQQMEAPYLNLASAPDWQTYETRYGVKALKNRRRQYRRLEETGPVSITHYRAGPEAQACTAKALGLKRAWLRDKGLVSPALADERTQLFFEAVTSDPSLADFVRVSALTAGGTMAAISVGFAFKDRLAVHLIAYAGAFEKAAAGALLMERSMKAAHEDGFAVYDLLAPGGGYKTGWADASADVCDYCLPLNAAGYAYGRLYLEVLRPKLKDLAFALEGAKRRFQRG